MENIAKVFKWKGKNSRGRKVKGEIVDVDRIQATMELERRKIEVSQVSEKTFSGLNPFSRIIKHKDITIFTRQLGMLLSSNMSLVDALSISSDSVFNPKLKSIIMKIRNDIVAGESFSDALAKYPKQFDAVYINMVTAGEKNGVLEETLLSIAKHREKNERLGAEFKKAMVYPALVLAFAAAVVLFMLIKIIPEFKAVYDTYDESLPDYTEFVLGIATYLKDNTIEFAVGLLIFLGIIFILKKTSYGFNLWLSKMSLKLPVLKYVFKKMAMVRFFQTTLITYKSGLALERAVYSASQSMKNVLYKEIFEEVAEDVSKGEKLSSALKNTGYIPEATIQFIESGESSGTLVESLERGATLYEDEMDDYFSMAAKSLEPIIMVAVSFIVGAIVIAMYLPIFYFGSIIN